MSVSFSSFHWFSSDPLEKGMATHSCILARRIQWIEDPGRLQSMGSQRVGHDWVTFTHLFICDYTESTLLPNFFFFFFFFFFWPCHTACGILVPIPWSNSDPQQWKMQSPNHWTTRNVFSCFSCDWLVANPPGSSVHGIFPTRILE